jgi:hypothetical protein
LWTLIPQVDLPPMRKRPLLLFLVCWLALPVLSFTGAHKFYVSVTNVEYAEKEESLQIISRIFIDDLEEVLQVRYDLKAELATPEESSRAEAHIEKYFRAKFSVFVNDEQREYVFLGKKYDRDQIICYLEVTGIPNGTLKSVGIRNEILMDLFEEQKNLVHVKIGKLKKSFVLVRESNKGMLNL